MPASSDVLFDQLDSLVQGILAPTHAPTMSLVVDLDLTMSQIRTTFVLADREAAMAITELADATGLSVAAQGRTVDQLVKLGIVQRRESETDRRVKLVSLTASGLELADKRSAEKQRALREFVDRLPENLCAGLGAALEPILAGGYLRPNEQG